MSIAKHRELLVLSIVRSHDLHGYALAEALEQGLGRSLGLKRPNVYAILARLVERGWVRMRSDHEGPHPERQICVITAAGQRAYLPLLRACVSANDAPLLPIIVLLAHLDDLPATERHDVLAKLRDQRRAEIEQLDALPEHEGSAGAALALMRAHLRADIQTIEGLLRRGHEP